jgi:Protein of unknown function (DUF3592)
MITCPWCGTNYLTFQSNCQNCGGPLPVPSRTTSSITDTGIPEDSLLMPPPAPRPISDQYVQRLLTSDGWAILAFVFALLGVIFTLVGVGLTLGIVTAFVGIPFSVLGLLFLGTGAALAGWRYWEAKKSVEVLQVGDAVEGQITQVEQNLHVRVNGRSPWVIRYRFLVDGQTYEGQVNTLNPPGATLQPGKRSYVLYLPQMPSRNTLYPHP